MSCSVGYRLIRPLRHRTASGTLDCGGTGDAPACPGQPSVTDRAVLRAGARCGAGPIGSHCARGRRQGPVDLPALRHRLQGWGERRGPRHRPHARADAGRGCAALLRPAARRLRAAARAVGHEPHRRCGRGRALRLHLHRDFRGGDLRAAGCRHRVRRLHGRRGRRDGGTGDPLGALADLARAGQHRHGQRPLAGDPAERLHRAAARILHHRRRRPDRRGWTRSPPSSSAPSRACSASSCWTWG